MRGTPTRDVPGECEGCAARSVPGVGRGRCPTDGTALRCHGRTSRWRRKRGLSRPQVGKQYRPSPTSGRYEHECEDEAKRLSRSADSATTTAARRDAALSHGTPGARARPQTRRCPRSREAGRASSADTADLRVVIGDGFSEAAPVRFPPCGRRWFRPNDLRPSEENRHRVFGKVVRVFQITRTFCASSPFLPGATLNSTRWPSSSVL